MNEIISPKVKEVQAIFIGVRYLGYENEFVVVPEEDDEWEVLPDGTIRIHLCSNGQNDDIVLEPGHRQMYSIRRGIIRRPVVARLWSPAPSAPSGPADSPTSPPVTRPDPAPQE